MYSKILQVFYGVDTLPYKDQERSVHFPIIGGAFVGASNTTVVRFYFERIGDENATYVVSAKLPNGKLGYKLCEKVYDNELGEWYAELNLGSFFTQAKGDLYISLRSYQGGAEIIYDDQEDIYKVEGDPIIQGTGSVKLTIAYAVPYQQGSEEEGVSFEDIFQELGKKLDIISDDYIKVVDDISEFADIEEYPNGTVIYDRQTKKFYKKTNTSPYYELYPFSNFYVEIDNDTLFSEVADLGHYVIVSKRHPTTTQKLQYLVATYKFSNAYYKFSILCLTNGYQRWSSYFESTAPINVPIDTTFAQVVADDSSYRQDLAIDNFIYISAVGNYDAKLIPQIAKSNCVVKFEDENYYPYSQSGNNIVFVCIRPHEFSAQNAYGKTQRQLQIKFLTFNNTGVSPSVSRSSWYFNAYYDADMINKSLGSTFDFTIDEDYKITYRLKSLNGTVLKSETIDLPLESVIVDGYYDDTTETLYLVLDNGTEISIPVHDLVEGLVNEDDLVANYYNKTQTDGLLNGKVDKITSGSKIYGTDNGSQVGLDYSAAPSGSGVAIRTNGSVQVPDTPPNSSCATNKTYVDNADSQKVDKTTSSNKIYGTDSQGNQKTFDVDNTVGADGNVVRRASGTSQIMVPLTPTANGHAASKKYVDDTVNSAIAAVYRYKGTKTVAEINALTGQVIGDVYNVSDAGTLNDGNVQVISGDNVAWTGTEWDKLANDIDWSEYNETFLAAGFIQAGPLDSVPEELTFDDEGNITNENWTGEITLDYMSPPITDIEISEVPDVLTFDTAQDYNNMITNADWTGIMSITY